MKVMMGCVFFVLKGLFVCLRESYMEVNCPIIIDIGEHIFMNMESMPIVK